MKKSIPFSFFHDIFICFLHTFSAIPQSRFASQLPLHRGSLVTDREKMLFEHILLSSSTILRGAKWSPFSTGKGEHHLHFCKMTNTIFHTDFFVKRKSGRSKRFDRPKIIDHSVVCSPMTGIPVTRSASLGAQRASRKERRRISLPIISSASLTVVTPRVSATLSVSRSYCLSV